MLTIEKDKNIPKNISMKITKKVGSASPGSQDDLSINIFSEVNVEILKYAQISENIKNENIKVKIDTKIVTMVRWIFCMV